MKVFGVREDGVFTYADKEGTNIEGTFSVIVNWVYMFFHKHIGNSRYDIEKQLVEKGYTLSGNHLLQGEIAFIPSQKALESIDEMVAKKKKEISNLYKLRSVLYEEMLKGDGHDV